MANLRGRTGQIPAETQNDRLARNPERPETPNDQLARNPKRPETPNDRLTRNPKRPQWDFAIFFRILYYFSIGCLFRLVYWGTEMTEEHGSERRTCGCLFVCLFIALFTVQPFGFI
jgi:hypothetical protein